MVATEIADYGGYKMHINGIDEKDNEIINLLLQIILIMTETIIGIVIGDYHSVKAFIF